jgi:LSD1 subclass zinc finger protein
MREEPETEIESRVTTPAIDCPNCEHLLPPGIGEIECAVCKAVVGIDHELTRQAWIDEKVSCPVCSSILVVGVEERPTDLRCSVCKHDFILLPMTVKVEITCPACERRLRIKQRPGSRALTCPACDEKFKVTF